MLYFDFETALMEPGLQIPPPVCMSAKLAEGLEATPHGGLEVGTPAGVGHVYLPDTGIDLLEHALATGAEICGLNVAFDLAVACEHRPHLLEHVFAAYDADKIFDVGTRQKLIDIALGEVHPRGYGLAALADRLLDVKVTKEDTWRLRYWELSHLDLRDYPDDALTYSAYDSTILDLIYRDQQDGLAEVDRLCVLADQHRQCKADFALRLASAWGLRTDPLGVQRLRTMCETEIAELEGALLEAGLLKYKYAGRGKAKRVVGVSRNIRAAQQRLLDVVGGWEGLPITEGGKKAKDAGADWQQIKYIQCNEEACLDSGDVAMKQYTQRAKADNMLNGFVKAVETGIVTPIHSHFEVLQNTGRTSSAAPNVQNVRTVEGSRECFVPREGWCYVGCDIDRAELHTLAQVCVNLFGSSNLADTLNAGVDPHTSFGARLAGMPYDALVAALKAKDPKAKDARQRAKPANFGFPGGMGANGMRTYARGYGIDLTYAEGQRLRDSWAEEFPEVAEKYLGWIRDLTQHGSATIEHFGSGRWRGGCSYCAAANSFFQGMAADGLKAMLWEVSKKCYLPGTPLYGCRIVNEIHDEILVEAPIGQASDAAYELETTMMDAYNTYTRDVPVSAQSMLMDRWSKGAERIVEDGVLQVWRHTT